MSYLLVCAVALLAAGLTLFSGFGLGTLLMPAFALFFPLELAIAATAVVHLANNLFKVAMLGRNAHLPTLARFAAPAIGAAILGAWLLDVLGNSGAISTYSLGTHTFTITAVKLAVAVVLAAFAAAELLPAFSRWAVDPRWVPVGGLISGFFGGLTGQQGALRAAFLIRCGLTKDQFIATGVVAACLVDLARLSVYASHRGNFAKVGEMGGWGLVIAASAAAFVGSLAGARLVRKVTLRSVQVTVAGMLLAMAAALGAGII